MHGFKFVRMMIVSYIGKYWYVNNRCKTKQKNRLHISKICPFVWASDRFLSKWTKSRPGGCGISICHHLIKSYHYLMVLNTLKTQMQSLFHDKKAFVKRLGLQYKIQAFNKAYICHLCERWLEVHHIWRTYKYHGYTESWSSRQLFCLWAVINTFRIRADSCREPFSETCTYRQGAHSIVFLQTP